MDETSDERPSRVRGADGGAQGTATERSLANNGWRADRPEDPRSLDTLWIRWTDGGSDLQFHRICDIVPQVEFTGDWPYLRARPEGHSPPVFESVREGSQQDGEEVTFRFVSGVPRQLLRHIPLVMLVATVAMFAGAELAPTPGVEGLSALFPQFGGADAGLFGLFLAIVPLLLWLLTRVDVVESRDLFGASVTYGLLSFLALGVLVSLFLAATVAHPSEMERNVVLTSGYLLTLLLGAMLLYEAVLRIEHMLVSLGKRDDDIIDDHREYRRFLTDLHDALNERRVLGLVHPSRLFGVLFAAQFLIIWTIGSGPQNMDYSVGLVVNFLLNAVLVTLVFKFFILVRYFNMLMNENTDYAEIGLHCEPFHVDGYGGFRDFGKFAIRINLILTLAGLYLVYRLYLVGGLEFPVEGIAGFEDTLALTVWLISFLGPVVAYAFGVAAWGYYSFWSIHSKMERDKQLLVRRYQGQRDGWDLDRTPSAGDTIDSFEDSNGPEWGAFRDAPTWPLDVGKMMSLMSGNALPLLIPVVNLFL